MARSNRKKSTPKTISAPGITGQRGINAIEQLVLASGSRWTASGPNEIGIDGYIEMFDPATRRPLGLTLAVQSKGVSTIATNNAPTFNYSCDPNDISYWLQGNAPVVLVVSSGDPAHTYSVPIREHFKNWKPGDSNQIIFIKAEHKLDQHSFPRLAAIAAPINAEVRRILEFWKLGRKNEYVFYNQKTGERFVDLDGGLELACKKAEIEGVTWHALRHTFASRLLERGADIITVKRIVGSFDRHRDDALHAFQSRLESGSSGQAGGPCYKSATPCTKMQQ